LREQIMASEMPVLPDVGSRIGVARIDRALSLGVLDQRPAQRGP